MATSGLLYIFIIFAIGAEGVLSSLPVSSRCGRRLVSGLFSRPRLPLGYSYVATVPRGACRLNVSEINPSENYIALKLSNGSYIMNGEFAVSAPGSYEAAGARFIYTRATALDRVVAAGPLQYPVDIMILYTQPNPIIKYEYFTESLADEDDTETGSKADVPDLPPLITKHTRRHHGLDVYARTNINTPRHPDIDMLSKEDTSAEQTLDENVIGTRRFIWKILSYTQCTRSCGGGIQVGKYRCVEVSANSVDREISPVHCSGSAPTGRRRRCGNIPCPPRWRAASWSSCPKCGPATRTRIVGCVQDHSRGITKISDQKCPPLKPITVEQCNIPTCEEMNSGQVRHIESKRGPRPREQTDTFREGPVYTVSVNSSDVDIGPQYSFSAVADWLYTEWSQCVGWCVGGGIQTRTLRCGDPSGCSPAKTPEEYRSCIPIVSCEPLEGHWFTGEWSPCSAQCNGKQVRGVLCIGGSGRHLRDSACRGPRPAHLRACGGECTPAWHYSEWGQCIGNCSTGTGIQRRSVVCTHGAGGTDGDCGAAPPAQRHCTPSCQTHTSLPPYLTVESQKVFEHESTSTQKSTTRSIGTRGCADKLNNCLLAVQARLCHYNYYVQNCCDSCRGR